jgi:hypothetical protein
MHSYLRGHCERADAADARPGTPIRFTASTEGIKRDGLDLSMSQWDLANYTRNNVVLWAHSYGGLFGGAPLLPIGKADVKVDGKRLLADVTFDGADPFAADIERKYRQGFLNAVSVGWDTILPAGKQMSQVAKDEIRLDLLDVSAVPIPGDPDALMERQRRALADYGRDLLKLIEPEGAQGAPDGGATRAAMSTAADGAGAQLVGAQYGKRGAIPYAKTAKAPEDTAWDGPGEVAKAKDGAEMRAMCAYVEDGADPDLKGSYKLPHHLAGSHDVVWRGVAAAMARCLQSGTDIPDADRKGVHSHLSRHYKEFAKEPPEYRSAADLAALAPREIRGLFLEGEPDLFPDLFAWADTRSGAVLSARNRDALERVQTHLAEARDLIQGVLASAKKEPAPEGSPTDETDAERAAAEQLVALHALLQGQAA